MLLVTQLKFQERMLKVDFFIPTFADIFICTFADTFIRTIVDDVTPKFYLDTTAHN